MPEVPGAVEVSGKVVEELPGALFRVELSEGTRQQVTAHAAPEVGVLRLLPGQAVVVQISSRDGSRGRILRKG